MKEFMELAQKIFENKLVQCLIVLLLAFILNRIVTRSILQKVNRHIQKKREDLRYETLFRVVTKVITVIIYFFAGLYMIQVLFNVSPASLIAATGVVGVAIGLGSQSLIKDSINGFFILLENQFSVGDLVTIQGFTGTVSEITLRITQIQNYSGDVFIIPNSTITAVTNHSRAERGVMIGVNISYDQDIDAALGVLARAGAQAKEELPELTEAPEVLGVAQLGDSGILVKMMVRCENGAQFAVEREMLRRVRYAFEQEQIEIPYNHVVLVQKPDNPPQNAR